MVGVVVQASKLVGVVRGPQMFVGECSGVAR